ncbi:MAG: rhodanese-like domain-containing protein [Oscillatoria sp. PMC 1051.18]|uniref:rhodanese-like domain-containing protein n=1 Tax=Oscillatoria salina TaxID=331517 RepID=UPI0013BE23E0|nr:rhodanese-like domain-containing protein [Oscillatoria salina]MBZ8180283.1 rhodanese-like domain-containing protein [Oscillatoria salina IIICB1]MEC5032102.1 rhodanese-like domain-containing protein [Oscillatoria sp. PMC 1051.18]NET87755.1 rhodanese-like domain-containing protein [Kamptonema sp. SIO1D9]
MTSTFSELKSQAIDLSPLEFMQLSNPPLLIDVRSKLEYATSHAPNAVNLSLPRILFGKIPGLRNWFLPQWFRDLSKEQPLAVICLTAHRSPVAAKLLIQEGFEEVFNITGGMREWQKLNLETNKSVS